MTREDVLTAARKCVCGKRQEDYGTPENSFEIISQLWTAWLSATHPELKLQHGFLKPKDVAMMMALLKIARAAKGDNPDNYIDLAGYAACAGELVPPIPVSSEAVGVPPGGEYLYHKDNQCVCCGAVIPEGRQVCTDCEKKGIKGLG